MAKEKKTGKTKTAKGRIDTMVDSIVPSASLPKKIPYALWGTAGTPTGLLFAELFSGGDQMGTITRWRISIVYKIFNDIFFYWAKEPIKPPTNPYTLYLRENLPNPDFQDLSHPHRMKEIALRWRGEEKEKKAQYYQKLDDVSFPCCTRPSSLRFFLYFFYLFF